MKNHRKISAGQISAAVRNAGYMSKEETEATVRLLFAGGMTRKQLSEKEHVTLMTIWRWRNGKQRAPITLKRHLSLNVSRETQ